jgi:hypothetical protein
MDLRCLATSIAINAVVSEDVEALGGESAPAIMFALRRDLPKYLRWLVRRLTAQTGSDCDFGFVCVISFPRFRRTPIKVVG